MKLLDTNVFIHYLKGNPKVVAEFQNSSRTELAIPAIVIYELEYGTLRARLSTRRRHELTSALEHIQQVPFDSPAAVASAGIRVLGIVQPTGKLPSNSGAC